MLFTMGGAGLQQGGLCFDNTTAWNAGTWSQNAANQWGAFWLTGAVPGSPTVSGSSGQLTIVDGGNYSESELNAARTLAGQGYDVVLRPPVGTRVDGGTSDLLINGVRYDVYTPDSSNPNTIFENMIKKNNQAVGLFVDLTNTTVTPEDLGGANVVSVLNASGASNIIDVIFYTGD
jgi:filamentous hemagglutinin